MEILRNIVQLAMKVDSWIKYCIELKRIIVKIYSSFQELVSILRPGGAVL